MSIEDKIAEVLAAHQRRSMGMSAGSPDGCACGAKTMPTPWSIHQAGRAAQAAAIRGVASGLEGAIPPDHVPTPLILRSLRETADRIEKDA